MGIRFRYRNARYHRVCRLNYKVGNLLGGSVSLVTTLIPAQGCPDYRVVGLSNVDEIVDYIPLIEVFLFKLYKKSAC